jgi:hypothetical protein
MKRIILILAALAIALALFNQFGNPQRTSKGNTDASSKTNTGISRPKFYPSPRTVHAAQTDLTNSVSADDEENNAPEKLSREQIEAYLLKTKRSPESLLNAFAETGDTNFLAEAVKNHSDNPFVQWTMLNQELSPEERMQWLAKLKVSSPDNALPNYLSALDAFKAGKTDQALVEIDSASKKKLSSFEQERTQSREEMYLLSGYSPLEAKEKTSQTLLLPNLREMKQLSEQIGELQQKYKLAGDDGSNQQLATVGVEIGRKYSDTSSPFLINYLVGNAMENIALNSLDSGTYYEFLGETAGERIQEIKNEKKETKDLTRTFIATYPNLSEAEKLIYINRRMLYGELNAMRWLNQAYGSETK